MAIFVIINSLNKSLYSQSVSANLIIFDPSAFMLVYLLKIASIIGSKVSCTSGMSTGYPDYNAPFMFMTKWVSENLNIFSSNPKDFLIHFMAYSYGSIINGHRNPFIAQMAFSCEIWSEGRPFNIHSRIVRGSPKVFTREKFSAIFN